MRRIAFLGALFLAACSRTTTDQREAYYAVFRSEVPATAAVKNALLRENRHLLVFYEYESYLEPEIDEPTLRAAMTSLGMRFEPFDATAYGFGSAPPWFAPRDGSSYLGWSSVDESITIIRSSKTKRVFVVRTEL